LSRWKSATRPQPYGYGRIQVTAGNVADGESHRQHGQPESQGDTKQPNTDFRECCCQYRAAADSSYRLHFESESGINAVINGVIDK
jgi:hypothetical protein